MDQEEMILTMDRSSTMRVHEHSVVNTLLIAIIVVIQITIGGTNLSAADASTADVKSEPWVFERLDGATIDPFDEPRINAIVLVFVSTDCPIANAYHPQLGELESKYRSHGVSFFLVHSTADLSPVDAQTHAEQFDLSIPVILDAKQAIARRVDAKVTPEVVVIQRGDERPIYRGAIDNRYQGYGKKRPRANQHYLQEAIDQWLAGEEIERPTTKPIGCFISFANR